MTVRLDTRELDPHPWERYLPEGKRIEIGGLDTGDIALARLPEGIVIERKTAFDLAGCIGASRERFKRELKLSRYCGRFIVVCWGTLADVCQAGIPRHRHELSHGNGGQLNGEVLPFHCNRLAVLRGLPTPPHHRRDHLFSSRPLETNWTPAPFSCLIFRFDPHEIP